MAGWSLLLLSSALLFQKLEWPFAQWIFLISTACLYLDLMSVINPARSSKGRIQHLGLLFGLVALNLRFSFIAGSGRIYAALGLIAIGLVSYWIFRQINLLRRINLICCLLLLLVGSLLGDWKFYHVFRKKNLEERLLSRLRDDQSNSADLTIERLVPHENANREAGDRALQEAFAFERARKWDRAKKAYDRAIYENPYAADAYLRRGSLKLLHLEIDKEQAESALRDFSRSIRLDSTRGETWFLRAHTLAYLGKAARVCMDACMASRLDTAYRAASAELVKRFCPPSGNLLPGMPLDP